MIVEFILIFFKDLLTYWLHSIVFYNTLLYILPDVSRFLI